MVLLACLVPTLLCLQYAHRRGTPVLARLGRVLTVGALLALCTTSPAVHRCIALGVVAATFVVAAVAWPHRLPAEIDLRDGVASAGDERAPARPMAPAEG